MPLAEVEKTERTGNGEGLTDSRPILFGSPVCAGRSGRFAPSAFFEVWNWEKK